MNDFKYTPLNDQEDFSLNGGNDYEMTTYQTPITLKEETKEEYNNSRKKW